MTAREVVVRTWVDMYWIWESIAFLDGANAALAFLAVLTGLDQEDGLPPLFG